MTVDTKKLLTVSNFAKLKDMSRQHIYRLVDAENLDLVKIDGVSFILLNEKAQELQRKGRK